MTHYNHFYMKLFWFFGSKFSVTSIKSIVTSVVPVSSFEVLSFGISSPLVDAKCMPIHYLLNTVFQSQPITSLSVQASLLLQVHNYTSSTCPISTSLSMHPIPICSAASSLQHVTASHTTPSTPAVAVSSYDNSALCTDSSLI